MFYETAQTIGPGWHRSYKPSHYEDMTWSPASRHFRSPGSSPETYRRIINSEDDVPSRSREQEDEFFNRSPTFPRRIFKEAWDDPPSANRRFADRPRMFKRVFKPGFKEFDDDIPSVRRDFDHNFSDVRPASRKFDEDFDRRFNARDLHKDIEQEFEKAEGRVHHIPIMVERRMEEMKSRFGRNSPPSDGDEYSEEWVGPQVQHLRKNFEPDDTGFTNRYRHHRTPKVDISAKTRAFTNPIPETWDPHAIHTLPTRKPHKSSQSFDDSRHAVPPKYVFRSYSETHEDIPRQQQQQHSAAFRSHSDGHCPNQTYVTKIEVNLPPRNENEAKMEQNILSEGEADEQRSSSNQTKEECEGDDRVNKEQTSSHFTKQQEGDGNKTAQASEERNAKPKNRNKYDNPSLQQIAVVLQNVEDLVVRVDGYNGTGRDKQYRFLDEMLTRCMLRLDDVDTEGREDIRNARKAALHQVQSCIDKLEAKAEESELLCKDIDSSSQTGSTSNDENNGNPNNEKEDKKNSNDAKVIANEEAGKKVDEEQTKL